MPLPTSLSLTAAAARILSRVALGLARQGKAHGATVAAKRAPEIRFEWAPTLPTLVRLIPDENRRDRADTSVEKVGRLRTVAAKQDPLRPDPPPTKRSMLEITVHDLMSVLRRRRAAERASPLMRTWQEQPTEVAGAFLAWVRLAGMPGTSDCEITVDAVWQLACDDFVPETGIALVPRRNFLMALKRMPGVGATFDRRVRGPSSACWPPSPPSRPTFDANGRWKASQGPRSKRSTEAANRR